MTLLGQPPRVGLTVAAGVAQIGEFSFILATSAFALGLLPEAGVQLVVSAAIVSITLNPLLFAAIDPIARRMATSRRLAAIVAPRSAALSTLPAPDGDGLRAHAVVIGSGRVGRLVIGALARRGFPFVVVSEDRHDVERLRSQGQAALFGDASNLEVLRHARIDTARVLVVAIPDEHASGLVVHHARDLNPGIALVVRTHSAERMATLGQMSGSHPADPGRARARGPDDALHAAPLRGQHDRGRGDRRGPARPAWAALAARVTLGLAPPLVGGASSGGSAGAGV